MANYFSGARYQGPRNRGGWPKTVFDPAARRQSDRALAKLESALEHISNTFGGEWGGLGEGSEPYRNSQAAWDVLSAAKVRVHDAYAAANAAAKAAEK
jgi:hypothetical protein